MESLRLRRVLLAIVGLMEFVRGGLLLVLLPTHLREELRLSLGSVGLALSAFTIADLVLKLPAGMLVDRAGRRFAMLLGVGFSVVALLVLRQAHTIGGVVAGAALFGAGAAPLWPAVVSSVGDQPEGRGAAMGGVFTVWLVGLALGAAVTAQLLGTGVFLPFIVLTAAAGLALGAVVAFVPAGRRASSGRAFTIPALSVVTHAFLRLYPLLVGMFLQTVAMGMLVPILAPYARTVLHLSPTQLALLFVAGPGLAVVLFLPLGRLADRLGPMKVVAGSVIAAPFGPLIIPACRTLACLVPLAAVLGAVYALILPAWNAVFLGRIPPQHKGLVLSLAMALEGIGGALGPVAGGYLGDAFGLTAPFYGASIVFAGIAGLYFYFLISVRGAF